MTSRSDVDRGALHMQRTPSRRPRLPVVLSAISLGVVAMIAGVLLVAILGASNGAEIPEADPFDLRPAPVASEDSPSGDPAQRVDPAPPEVGDRPEPGTPTTSASDEPAETEASSASPTPEAGGVEDPAPVVPVTSGRLDDLQSRSTAAVPIRLVIPSIDVDAEILPVGYQEGEMEIPPTADTVGWYEYGPAPGETGSSVLAAHVAWQRQRGVFWDLTELPPGAEFEVRFDDGSSRWFRTVALDVYDKAELPTDDVFRRDGAPVVTLITCGGAFNPSLRAYDDNVVALAVEIDRPME